MHLKRKVYIRIKVHFRIDLFTGLNFFSSKIDMFLVCRLLHAWINKVHKMLFVPETFYISYCMELFSNKINCKYCNVLFTFYNVFAKFDEYN